MARMYWLFAFFASWIVFFVLVRREQSKLVYFGGVIAIALQLCIDINANKLGIYYISGAMITFHGSPLCFTFGIVLSMGIIFLQYLPRHRWWQVAHIVVFSLLFMIFEIVVIHVGNLEYIHWNFVASTFVDYTVFMALCWYGTVFVKKEKLA